MGGWDNRYGTANSTSTTALCARHAYARIVGLRLTVDEAQRLDQLVEELGHKDRSALLRAWLAQSSPVPRMADDASSHPARVKATKASEPPKQTAPSEKLNLVDLIEMLQIAIQREKDPRSGLSRVPNVIRSLLPHFTAAQIHAVMSILHGTRALELHPNGREQLRDEDAALCLYDAGGTALSRMRWIGKG